MRASDLLDGRDSGALRVRLLPVVPEQVRVRPLPVRLPGQVSWVAAITLPWGIYVRPDVLAGSSERLADLIVHELAHARQWRTLGPVAFLVRYLGDYLWGRARGHGHRQAYRRIRLEEEAELLASRP